MSHTLTGADIRAWRKHAGLDQETLARKLGVAREWLSKIENGKTPVSSDIYLAFERVTRESKNTLPSHFVNDAGSIVSSAESRYGTPDSLRKEIRRLLEDTIGLAGDDMGKLGWLREQLIRHASAPEHWDLLARVIARNLKKRRETEEAAAAEADHSARDQGKAS